MRSLGVPWSAGGSALIAVAVGAILSSSSSLAILLAIATLGVAVLSLSQGASVPTALALTGLALSATVDLPRRLTLGPTTAYAWITGLIVAISAIVLVRSRTRALSRTTLGLGPALVFPAWAFMSLLVFGLSLSGAQNALVYLALPLFVGLAAHATSTGLLTFERLRTVAFWSYSAAGLLYVGSLAVDGIGGSAVVGARSYAVFAVTGVAWGVALVRQGYRRERWLVALSLLLILLSLSRTAFAIALLLILVSSIDTSSVRRVNRTFALLSALVITVLLTTTHFGAFSQRFTEGDVQRVTGSIAFNVSGRVSLWDITTDSALRSPLFGQGAGSAEQRLAYRTGRLTHPHNDYLRIFHDFGLIGLALWLLGLLSLLSQLHLRRNDMRISGSQGGALYGAAMLSVMALLLLMTTDNALVYLFAALPIAIFLGTSLGYINSPIMMQYLREGRRSDS